MKSQRLRRGRTRRQPRRPRLEGLEQRQLLAADGLTLVADSHHVEQNSGAITFDVLGNDLFDDDYAGNRQITSISTGSLGGRIEVTDDARAIRYTAPADASGVETFHYWVDGVQSTSVSVEIVSPLRPFHETIYQFHDEYHFDLLRHAQFGQGYSGDKRITLISETAGGAEVRISDDGQSVIYQLRIGFVGKDQFSYIVDDLYVGTAEIDVVNPLRLDKYEVIQNSGTTRLDVLTNDFPSGQADPGIDLSDVSSNARITHVLSSSENFQVAISADGRAVEFTPSTDSSGTYNTFRYVVNGQFEQTVQVAVQRPVRNDSLEADVDGGVHTLNVLSNDHYRSIFGQRDIRVVDRVTSVTQGDQGGTVAIAVGGTRVLYTPPSGFEGIETFEYVADERHTATVSVNVTPPVRDDWQSAHVGITTSIDVLANDFQDDTVGAIITSVTQSDIGATILVGPGGQILYTPPEDAFTRQSPVYTDSFEYTVNDQFTASVRVNLLSLTSSDSYPVDQPTPRTLLVLENDFLFATPNYTGNRLITSVSEPSDGGIVSINADGQSLQYQPGSTGETFTYTVDEKYTETVRAYEIRRLNADYAVADQNGPSVTIDVKANDFRHSSTHGTYQGDRIVTSVTQSEQGGIVSITNQGKVSYQPPVDFLGRDTFTYQIDGFLSEVVRVDVFRRAADDLVGVAPDSQNNTLNVLSNDILGADYAGSGLVSDVTATDAGAHVEVADSGRSIRYTPPVGFIGDDTFVYTLDGQSKATVTVSVRSEDDGLLSKFESVEQLRDHLLALSIDRYEYLFGSPVYRYDYLEDRDVYSLAATSAGGPDFSETNVQVAGVDEDDIVETDGHFIYTLRNNELTIVKSLPADELTVSSSTEIEGTPIGMYLSGDRVTVISRLYVYDDPVPLDAGDSTADSLVAGGILYGPWIPRPVNVTTIVTVLDVADRTSPTVVQRTTFEGNFSQSRRIGDQVFLVLESRDLRIEPEPLCDADGTNCVYETEQQFTDRILRDFPSLIVDKLPGYESFDKNGDLVRGGPIVLPEDIYQSIDNSASMTIVASINMASSEPGLSATSGVMADSNSDIYATAEHLYVFHDHRDPVENEPWTRILMFDWNGQSGAIDFAALGDVPGTLLNQFSADEHEGLLRVTTAISNRGAGNFSGRDETALFILQEDNGILEFVGNLQNLALGQNVKSVRYDADRAFVTTFQTIDPLHAIDLSDPTNPRALGHVPLPGFSSYMQFIAEDRLLTVGTNTATGFGGRAMVSLFDVSDLTSPRLIESYNLPRFSTSEASVDHHAFGWFARHGILAVPTRQSYYDRFDDDGDGFRETTRRVDEDSLSLLHIGIDASLGEEGISLGGRIDHAAAVLRSVYVNDHVYSIGLDAIRTAKIGDLSSVVDEVLFDEDSPTTIVPRGNSDHVQLAQTARQQLADHANVNLGSVMLVTHESRDGRIDIILRADGGHYRFRGTSEDDVALIDDAYQFTDSWHNGPNPHDTNGDGKVTAADALLVINEMARRGGSELPVDRVLRQVNAIQRYVDTNGDGRITALDALQVINKLAAQQARPSAEAELVADNALSANRAAVIDEYFLEQLEQNRRLLF